jgi:hypothetical protein
MLANKLFLATELVHVYGPGLVAAGLGSATVIWQVKSGNTEVKNEIKADISRVKNELKADISRVEKKTDMMNDNILMVAREVTTAMETKNYKGMDALAARIKRCQESGGEDC